MNNYNLTTEDLALIRKEAEYLYNRLENKFNTSNNLASSYIIALGNFMENNKLIYKEGKFYKY